MSNEITTSESTTQAQQPATSSASPSETSKTDAAVEQVIDSAVGLGRLWARHGLTIGKLALETSATSLGTTARMLASLAEALAPSPEEQDHPHKA